MLGISTTNARVGGFRGGISAEAKTIYNRIIADGGVSNLSRLNFFVKGLKAIYGDLANVPVCYDAHWIGYKLGSGTGATSGQAAAKLYSIKNTENLLTFSEQFDNAVWAKTGVTITANSVNSPTGTLTADLVTPTISDAKFTQGFIPTSAMQHNFSIYLRSATGSSFSTVLRITRDSPFSNVANTVITVTTEWQRFDLTFTTLDATTHQATIGGASTLSTGENLYAWGAQLNTGSVALPYTQTTTTAETLADAIQSTAASQPLLLSHNGDNYWYGSGVTGNYVSTPNAAANQITGDIEIKATAKYIFNGSYAIIAAKWGAQTSFRLYIGPTDRLIFDFGGLSTATSTVVITSTMNHFRATRNTTNGNILFYYSNEAITTDINSVTWIQLGTTISGTVGSFTSSTNNVTIGQELSNAFQGKIYRATISNTIGGAPVVDFNPATYNASTSQTAWTSSTGEVWTINTGTATTGYKGCLVSKTIVMSDGVDDTLTSTISGSGQKTQYFAIKMFTYTNWLGGLFASNNARGGFTVSANKLAVYAGGASVAPFGTVSDTKLKQFSFLLGTTATNWEVQENGIDISNGGIDIGTNGTFDNVTLFSRGGGVSYQNMLWNTYILSNLVDNTTTKTATYNLIRSLNNNAF